MKKLVSLMLAILMCLACFGTAEGVYPLEGDKKLSLYVVGGLTYHNEYTSEDESPYHQYMEEYTGVDIEWLRAPAGADENMAYNMMIANGEYPDMVFKWDLPVYAESAIADGLMIPLEDYIPEHAPAFAAYLEEHPAVRKAITTDSGHIAAIPFLYEDPAVLGTTQGMSVSVDLLDEVGLEKPVTISDWEEMLYAFKELESCTLPLATYGAAHLRFWFGNAFGFNGYDNFYVDANGEVATWMNAEYYKDFLTTMNRWYEDGLIDKDFATTDIVGLVSKILTGKVGVAYYGVNSPARFYDQIIERDGAFFYEPVQQVVGEEGDPILYAMGANEWLGVGTFITSACDDIPTALRFLDWFFTDEGFLISNFGKEGVSFYYDENGKPQIMPELMNAAEGSTVAISRYSGMTGVPLGIQGIDWFFAKALPFVPAMFNTWNKDSQAGSHHWPCISATTEEGTELAALESAVRTYAEEMYLNFIIGAESLDNYDEYVKNINEMGLERILEIKAEQLARYNAR